MKQSRKLLLLGSFGQDNLGDDALFYSFLYALTNEQHIERIFVNVSDPSRVPAIDSDKVSFFETYGTGLRKRVSIIRSVDAVVFCGGSLLKELYRNTGRAKYSTLVNVLLVAALARILGKRIFAFNIGIGPIRSHLGLRLANIALSFMHYVVTRDRKSLEYVNKSTLKSGKVLANVDAVFMGDGKLVELTNDSPVNLSKLRGIADSGNSLIGVNLVYNVKEEADEARYRKGIVELVNGILEARKGPYIVFFPFQKSFNEHNDLVFFTNEVYKEIREKERVVVLDDLSVRNVLAYLKLMNAFVGMRYHSLVFCTIAKVPFIPLAYDEKVTNYVNEMNYPYYFDVASLDKEKILKSLVQVLHDRVSLGEFLYQKHQEFSANAATSRELLLQSLVPSDLRVDETNQANNKVVSTTE